MGKNISSYIKRKFREYKREMENYLKAGNINEKAVAAILREKRRKLAEINENYQYRDEVTDEDIIRFLANEKLNRNFDLTTYKK